MSSAPARPLSGLLNPTLSVEAYFLVQFPGDVRRTQLALKDHPDVAAWLLSFLDYLLSRQGKIPGERRIADPPGGDARAALLRGGVILEEQRPDGQRALRLNPSIGEMGLYVYARLRQQPALDIAFSLGKDPAVSRWLLQHYLGGSPLPGDPGLSPELAASLGRYGVLVDEPPAESAWFPDPLAPADPASDLTAMSAAFPQPAGEPIPGPVREILGRHTPALPVGTPLVWGQDAGTGLVFPALWPALWQAGDAASGSRAFRGADADRRAARWARQRVEAREAMATRRYAVLREILPPAQRARLRAYVRQLADRGYFPTVGLDQQVELRRSMYRQPTVGSLHNGLARLLSDVYGQPLIGSFNQLGLYEAGAELVKHTDRPQCVLNLSLVLDMQGPEGDAPPWPIHIEMDGRQESIELQIGDGLAYSGVEVLHWRDPLPAGQRAIVAFFFFVPPDFAGSLD